MKLKPLGNRIIVKPLETEKVTSSGIIIPETAEQEQKSQGEIVAVGDGDRIKRLGLKPEQCVYVGDNPEVDFAGAKTLGIRTVLIDRKARMKPEGLCVKEEWEPAEWITSLYELEAILRGFQESGDMQGHCGSSAGCHSMCSSG